MPGSGGLAAESLLVGKAPTATGFTLYRALAQSANSKKKKTDSAGSRSSFKEKGDKSCFTDFIFKQQACQRFDF